MNSKKWRNVGLAAGLLAFASFGLIIFYYSIVIPLSNQSQMKNYSGTYIVSSDSIPKKNSNELNLFKNGSYSYYGDKKFIRKARIQEKGFWKTGGIDGVFDFRNLNNSSGNWASPFGSKGNEYIIFNLYDRDEVKFVKKKE